MSWRFLRVGPTRWTHRKHQDAIDHLREESRVLREQLGRRRLRLTDLKRRHVAAKGTILVSELL